MLSPQALFKLLVSRALPVPNADSSNSDTAVRGGRYGEVITENKVSTKHSLADEGSYFVNNFAQTPVALLAAAQVAFTALSPSIVLYNGSSTQQPVNLYLDFLKLTQVGAPTGATSLQAAIVLDTGNRYVSGATGFAVNKGFSPNGGYNSSSQALTYGGPLTASAAVNARSVVGDAYLKASIPTAGDVAMLTVGAVDGGNFSSAPGAATGPSR